MRTGLVALALLALPVAAQELVLDPAAPRPVAVQGEQRDVVYTQRLAQRLERTVRGGPTRTLETEFVTEAAWLQEVREVEDGEPTAVRVTFARWGQRTQGEAAEDTSLQGRVASLRPRQTEGRVTLEAALPAVSSAATTFLERLADRLRDGGGARDGAFVPPRAVAAGARWDVTPRAELAMGAPFTDIDAARSRLEVTLGELDASGRVTATLAGALQLLTVPNLGGVRFTRGGECRLEVRATWTPGDRPSRGDVEEREEVSGEAHGQLPEGTPFELKVALRRLLHVTEQPHP